MAPSLCITTHCHSMALLRQQFHALHASVSAASLPQRPQHASSGTSSSSSSCLVSQHQQQQQHRQHRAVQTCASSAAPGWLPQQQQQQSQPRPRRRPGSPQQPQERPPGLLQRRRRLDGDHQLQQAQQQQPVQQRQHTTSEPQQQQEKFTWGYLNTDAADDWTWDDDYNEDAIARAAAEARQLPPTPRQQQLAAAAAVSAQQRPTVITRLPGQFNRQVLSNAVLLVDKPARWSSADVVRQLKAALKVDKICFGAPLDTEATGLLIVLLGAASRLTPKLEPLERTYTGTFRLGLSTTTYDASGETLEANPWQHVSDADVAAAAQGFVGEISQVPCMWSSSKYRNKPLRWYAERGEVVAREPKAVYITSIQTWRGSSSTGQAANSSSGSDTVCFRVVASKGASVRVLVHDIGRALGCGAHVTSVRREGLGGFSVDTAWSLEVLLPLARKYAKGFRQQLQMQQSPTA